MADATGLAAFTVDSTLRCRRRTACPRLCGGAGTEPPRDDASALPAGGGQVLAALYGVTALANDAIMEALSDGVVAAEAGEAPPHVEPSEPQEKSA